ncbi:hypothetical protein V1517DRAFT_168413 [Lipomyces orientalis]|uniref:Uncharacterized protein n=1 Tax=Lipomyces orientalis TaxID=1233043 RepID=A0ACC3TNE6_9ASCO
MPTTAKPQNASSGQLQCNGIAKSTNKQCRRTVDSKYALDDKTAYCFQHRYQAGKPIPWNQKHVSLSHRAHRAETSNELNRHDRARVNSEKIVAMRELHAEKKNSGFSRFWRRMFCMYVEDPSHRFSDRRMVNRQQSLGPDHQSSLHPRTNQAANRNTRVEHGNVALVSAAVRAKYVNLLAEELKKPISQADEAGYIYIFELGAVPYDRALIRPDTVLYLKIGRAKDVDKRMHQWTTQCSHTVVLTGHYPSRPGLSSSDIYALGGGPKCRAVHRAERLIHLELRAMFPCSADRDDVLPPPLTGSVRYGICSNCGKRHTEWFAVRQIDAHVVTRIIAKWIEHVGVI